MLRGVTPQPPPNVGTKRIHGTALFPADNQQIRPQNGVSRPTLTPTVSGSLR